jgi:hypothetical protein
MCGPYPVFTNYTLAFALQSKILPLLKCHHIKVTFEYITLFNCFEAHQNAVTPQCYFLY